jgi:hypothetical protein
MSRVSAAESGMLKPAFQPSAVASPIRLRPASRQPGADQGVGSFVSDLKSNVHESDNVPAEYGGGTGVKS